MRDPLICTIVYGEAKTKKGVEHIAKRFGKCPHVNLMATKGKQLFATFFLPKRERWWIEYVEKRPEITFGLRKAKVTIVDNVNYPKKLEERRPKKLQRISPCGSNCGVCPSYKKCLGCPATIFYKHTRNGSIRMGNVRGERKDART